MKSLGKIKELFISKEHYGGRISQMELLVDEDGVFIDKYYGKDKIRSILIVSIEAYKIVKEKNIDIDYGDLSENILVDFDLKVLKEGMQIEVGEVILQITQNCTICNNLAKIDPTAPDLLKDDRGIFAKVIKGGMIIKNSEVKCV